MDEAKKQLAWSEFVKAETAHKGHGGPGQGSPITKIVWDYHADVYRKIWEEDHSGNGQTANSKKES